jgi:hypothetical protein
MNKHKAHGVAMSNSKINPECKDTIDYFFNKLFLYLFCKLVCWLVCIYFLIACIGQAHAQTNPLHEMFHDEFTGKRTAFVYTENDQIKVEWCTRVIGNYKPGLKAFSLKTLRADADKIPTACLAAQHVWMVFQMQQRAQAELYGEVELFKKEQKRLKQKCMIDNVTCGGLTSFAIVALRDYWISFSLFEYPWKLLPARKEDWITHFKTGIDGLDNILAWRDWVKAERVKLEKKRK